jgi:oligopeptidase B
MNPPSYKKTKHISKFGFVKNELRGYDDSKLIKPPKKLVDHYYWLRDDSRENKKILSIIDQENDYTDHILKHDQPLKNALYNEIKSYMLESYDTYKYKYDNHSNYLYFKRFIKGNDYPIHMREKNGTEEVLLDINQIANGKKECDVTGFSVSPDHKYISYGVCLNGSENYQFVLQNTHTNTITKTTIPKLHYCSYTWGSKHLLYYLMGDKNNRLYQLWVYNLNNNTKNKLFEETNGEYDIDLTLSNDEHYIFLTVGNYDENYTQYIDISKNETTLIKMTDLIKGLKYTIDSKQDHFYIQTNKDNATNWKLMRAHKQNHSIDKWEEFIPHNKHVYMTGFELFKNYIVFTTNINGSSYINITTHSKTTVKVITHVENKTMEYSTYINQDFAGFKTDRVYVLELGLNYIYDSNTLNVMYDTMTSPVKYFNYNMVSMKCTQVYEKIVPNYDESLYECKRLWAPQEDTSLGIPISIVYRKDKYKHNNTNPLYLYGYGAYGSTVEPEFDFEILPLLNAGFVYAIAHVRGGSFLGYDWYLQGKMYNKMNTFTDFIRCAEYLGSKKSRICDPRKIAIEGRSAGGLLIGAVTTMRPDLFWISIPGVPFVDVMHTMSDSTIPLTTEEWSQWGNPNETDGFANLLNYCPYSNIKEGHYPNMYCTAGLHDTRVPYWEVMKFIAKIREYKQDDNIQVIRIETIQGHFGGSSRYKSIEELSEKYAFVLSR